MPYWGMAMAQGPYVNMDGDMELNMKASCAAVDAGLTLSLSLIHIYPPLPDNRASEFRNPIADAAGS